MKKFLGLIIISALMISGCSEKTSQVSDVEITTTAAVTAVTETVTEAVITKPAEEKLVQPTDGNYIYDNAKILSKDDLNECNNYAGWINSNLMLNTAVVTTDKLDKLPPEKYAEKCYNDIFQGMGSGIILLINNETNKDFLYKHGTPLIYITENAEKEAFFYATKSIVNGDYKSGILELLSLAEACPKHIFDNGSLFNYEQIIDIESGLATRSDINAFIVTTNNITDKTNSELADDFYNRCSKDKKDCKMLFLDKKFNEVIAMGDFPEDISGQLKETVKSKDYYKAAKDFLKACGIASA